jgi:hypothetical protein
MFSPDVALELLTKSAVSTVDSLAGRLQCSEMPRSARISIRVTVDTDFEEYVAWPIER